MKILIFALVGLAAQMVDGALGMAFGVTATTLLIFSGLGPAHASAAVHFAELGTTLFSGLSHWRLRNVHWPTVVALGVPGAAVLAGGLEARHVIAVRAEARDLLLQSEEVVEASDLGGHVERRGVVQQPHEVERAGEAVGLARGLDELDELLVERELARGDRVGRQLVVVERVAQDVEHDALAREARVVWSAESTRGVVDYVLLFERSLLRIRTLEGELDRQLLDEWSREARMFLTTLRTIMLIRMIAELKTAYLQDQAHECIARHAYGPVRLVLTLPPI